MKATETMLALSFCIVMMSGLAACGGGGGDSSGNDNNSSIAGTWVGTCSQGYSATLVLNDSGSLTYSDSGGASSIGTYSYDGETSLNVYITQTNGQGCTTPDTGDSTCLVNLSGDSLAFLNCIGGTYTR